MGKKKNTYTYTDWTGEEHEYSEEVVLKVDVNKLRSASKQFALMAIDFEERSRKKVAQQAELLPDIWKGARGDRFRQALLETAFDLHQAAVDANAMSVNLAELADLFADFQKGDKIY